MTTRSFSWIEDVTRTGRPTGQTCDRWGLERCSSAAHESPDRFRKSGVNRDSDPLVKARWASKLHRRTFVQAAVQIRDIQTVCGQRRGSVTGGPSAADGSSGNAAEVR